MVPRHTHLVRPGQEKTDVKHGKLIVLLVVIHNLYRMQK